MSSRRRSPKEWSPALWLWAIACLLMLAALLSQLPPLFLHPEGVGEAAIESGQRVVYKVATHELLARKKEGAPAAEEEPEPETPPAAEEPSTEEPTPEAEEKPEEALGTGTAESAADIPVGAPEGEAVTEDMPAEMAESSHEEKPVTEEHPAAEETYHEPPATAVHAEAVPASAPLWQRNAMPFSNPDRKPIVVVVIAQAGLSKSSTQRLLETLPSQVTLSFSPYADAVASWVSDARARGHETLLDLPMEPVDYPMSDPGPLGLLTNMPATEITQKVDQLLALDTGAIGLMGPLREQFTRHVEATDTLLRAMKSRNQIFLLGQPGDAPEFDELEKSIRAPVLRADLQIDMTPERAAVDAQLLALEMRAKEKGFAIGVAQPYPVVAEALADWADQLPGHGLLLAPASAILRGEWTAPVPATEAAPVDAGAEPAKAE